jgi:tubulin polyglutamylase TTLL9
MCTCRVNHFRNFYELTRKDLLVKNLKRAKRSLQKKGREDESNSYDFFPDTYCLPAEYSLFVEAFKKSPGISWIMKPIGSSQGKGIFLFERLAQISEWKNSYVAGTGGKPEDSKAEKYIVQRYLSDPLLIGGKKFDLR